jgi:hypothetical protein
MLLASRGQDWLSGAVLAGMPEGDGSLQVPEVATQEDA